MSSAAPVPQQNGSASVPAPTKQAQEALPTKELKKKTTAETIAENMADPKKKLRKKEAVPIPLLKYIWLAGHTTTICFGLAYFYYYCTLRSHKSIIAAVIYRFSLAGVLASYTVAILSQFDKKSLPNYYALMVTENFQYLTLALAWFVNRNSAFKLLPFWTISLLQLSSFFKLKQVLKLETIFKRIIIYDELLLFVMLLVDTLLMRGTSGYGLVIYALFYWLRLLRSEDTRFFIYSIIIKLDGVMSKQKNETVVHFWTKMKHFLTVKQSKFESQYIGI